MLTVLWSGKEILKSVLFLTAGAVLGFAAPKAISAFDPAKDPFYIPPPSHPGWMRIESRDIADYIPCEDGEAPQIYHLEGVKPYHYQLSIACQHGRLIGLTPQHKTEGR